MDFDTTAKLVQLISLNVLTPIIYMRETEDMLEFICFCDKHITMQEIYDVETSISELTGKKAEIIDIREYCETERIEVIHDSELIYSEHSIIEQVFTQSMIEDYRIAMAERKDVLNRGRSTGTYYIQ